VLLPLLVAAVNAVLRRQVGWQRFSLVLATIGNLAVAGFLFAAVHAAGEPVAAVFGGWETPVGIGFHADLLSTTMVLVTAVVALAGALYALGEIGRSVWLRHYGVYYLLLIAGINGAFLTGDLFNLFVWFEVMLMSSFAMMTLGRRRHTFAGATKYVVINMVSSFLFLAGLGIIYGKAGSLNLADVAARLAEAQADPLIFTSAGLLLAAFGIKAGVFPLFFWLPASYPQTGFTTAAVFGGLLTKVGVYALFRVFGGAFGFLSEWTGPLFLWGGAATMVAGVLGAASQYPIRRILSFHIVSQIGYLVLGLFTQGAMAAAIFYTVHHILVKTNLFFLAGIIARIGGNENVTSLGGLLNKQPLIALLFAIPALSLAGIPPLSGFFAKFLLLREAFRESAFVWGAIALAVGLLTLFSMTKIWAEAFWKDASRTPHPRRLHRIQLLPCAALGLLTLLIGLFVGPLHQIAKAAAQQILAP
jgi:multicomponent Na+:H+ antiporter subunit D